MKKLIWLIVLVLIIAGAWWWGGGSDETEEGEVIKIGLATVLTGDFAAAGENMVNAARLTVDQINQAGGIRGKDLELVVEDAGWTSRDGLNAVQKLINTDEVHYIVGGTSSNGTLAAAPLVNEKRVPYLTPVTGGRNVDEAGEYVFRIANADVLAGRDIANAMIKLGFKRVGAIAEVTEYTQDIKQTFEEVIDNSEVALVFNESFTPETTDFRTFASKVKAAQPEAVLIASQTGLSGAHFIKQSREIGYDGVFFSDFTFIVNEEAKGVVDSFEGIYFADPAYNADDQETLKFLNEYEQRFGISPLIPFHALATRDSVVLLVEALREVGDNQKGVRDWLLENVQNWEGLMGTFSLDGKGNSDLGFDIKVVRDGEFVKLEELKS